MGKSAILDRRAARRREIEHRIQRRACELAIEHGYDGFTMEQLADDCDISRRTLFNHVGGKEDAVLGGPMLLDEDLLEEFVAGGPTGSLLPDLAALVREVMTEHEDVTPYDVTLGPRVLTRNPQLADKEVARFADYVQVVRAAVATREGVAESDARVTLTLELVLALVRSTLETYAGSDGTVTLADEFTRTLDLAIDLAGPAATRP